MIDFDEIFEDEQQVRRDKLGDQIGRFLYNEVFGRDEKYVESFKMSDFWSFFLEKSEEIPKAEKCLLRVEEKKRGYKVLMILLDANGKPIYKTDKACYGKELRVEKIDGSVLKYLGGKKSKIANKPELN